MKKEKIIIGRGEKADQKPKAAGKNYRHLNQKDRDRIDALHNNGAKQKDIARIMGVDKSTISREIKRNRRRKRVKGGIEYERYEAAAAQQKAYVKRKYAKYQGKKINENNGLRNYIIEHLKKHWSPDEISGRMRKTKQPFRASKTTVYEWLYSNRGQYYCRYLYSRRYKPKKMRKNKAKKVMIPNKRGLELRPKGANNRTRYGHYESDTVVSGRKTGSRQALSVAYERKAKYVSIEKIQNLKPESNNQAVMKMKNRIKIKSTTMDNGIENTKYEETGIPSYFCDSYSAWQKPGVENANKMIRRFIPKGCDIGNYSREYVKMVENIINNKPRKSLNYKTALEVMREHNLLIEN